ncbi:MAG: ATP-binding cassette domain-containing protein [Bacteroidetes bacterium]|nr:ATP-binding cassette domain-containing protein [Bacteroidota bacterium]
MVLSVENLVKNYQEVKALKSITFSVQEGEIFGLIGPDGAGKTTLFRIIASLLLPDNGRVTMFDMDVVDKYKKIRKIIGYMPQRFSLYHDLTVEENLAFFATVFGTNIRENYDLVKDIYSHIEPFRKRKAGKLSGGMKQKLALSCALIHRPKLLLLDEPTTGVDAVSRKEFWEMLKNLKNKGMTILVSTPYMDEARLCGRVALIQDGRILTLEKPENIIKNYDRKLLAIRSDNMYGLITDLRNEPNAFSVHLFGQFVHYNQKNRLADRDRIFGYLTEKGHQNIEIHHIDPIIEDCFMNLMGEKQVSSRQ